MNTLREAVEDYVAMRRALGFKLREAGKGLVDFAGFLQKEHASYITVPLALKWATADLFHSTGGVGVALKFYPRICPLSPRH